MSALFDALDAASLPVFAAVLLIAFAAVVGLMTLLVLGAKGRGAVAEEAETLNADGLSLCRNTEKEVR